MLFSKRFLDAIKFNTCKLCVSKVLPEHVQVWRTDGLHRKICSDTTKKCEYCSKSHNLLSCWECGTKNRSRAFKFGPKKLKNWFCYRKTSKYKAALKQTVSLLVVFDRCYLLRLHHSASKKLIGFWQHDLFPLTPGSMHLLSLALRKSTQR